MSGVRQAMGCAALAALLAGCEVAVPFAGEPAGERAPAEARPASQPAAGPRVTPGDAGRGVDLEALARRPAGRETVCQRFARRVAEAALRHGSEAAGFLAELQEEFIGGTDDPFEMKEGLRTGGWNPRYFYAGHGGFRPEYDDAERYPDGGNHQPGHFVSVLSVAARFGEEQARIAIAYAGDYEPGEEDDLRLSNVAIPLGAGLRDGSVTPADVAQAARALCR